MFTRKYISNWPIFQPSMLVYRSVHRNKTPSEVSVVFSCISEKKANEFAPEKGCFKKKIRWSDFLLEASEGRSVVGRVNFGRDEKPQHLFFHYIFESFHFCSTTHPKKNQDLYEKLKKYPHGQDSAKFFFSHATFEGLLDVRTPPTMPQVGWTWICFCWEVGSTNPLNRPNFHKEVVWFFQSHKWVFESRTKDLLNLYSRCNPFLRTGFLGILK